MEVVLEGFSIREYASKMRSIDVVKCWPFSGASCSSDDDGNSKTNKQTVESLLPPISVTKFRWWSEELDFLKSTELANIQSSSSSMVKNKLQGTQPRNQSHLLQVNLHVGEKSDERLDMLECPVCGVFAASTMNALNAHVDGCLAQASRQERRQMKMAIKSTKSKTPKKRSIIEIFAAAPQIHKLDVADDENMFDEDENGGLEKELNCKIQKPKKKMKKKKKKVAIMKMLTNKKRKRKKNKNQKQDGLIANKDNGSKLKLQTPKNSNRKRNNICNRGSNAISSLRKKPSMKCLSAKKKSKVVQASKLTVEHGKQSLPVRGILKNSAKCISGQNAAMCDSRATKESACGFQHLVRHVSFPGKDGILVQRKKHVGSFEKSICHIDLDSFELSEKGHENEGDKEFPTRVINRSDDEDVSFHTENGIVVQAMMEKQQLPGIHYNADIPKFLGPCIIEQEKANQFSDRLLPPGQVVFDSGNSHVSDQGNQTAFHSTPYTVFPRLFSSVKEIQNPLVNSQKCGAVSTALNYSSLFVDYFGGHTQEVATSSKQNPRASLQPSSSDYSLSKDANEAALLTSQFASENVSGHAFSCQPLCHLSSTELIEGMCPFPEWKQKEVAFSKKYRDQEFLGLPLNSEGELVQANSSGKGGFNQLKKSSPASGSSDSMNNLFWPTSLYDHSTTKGRHFIESALSGNQLSLFPAQNHVKENATVHSPARLGDKELQGHRKDDYCTTSDRRCNPSVSLMDLDLNLMNISFNMCRQYDQFQNQKEQGISHAKENAEKMLLSSPPPTMRLMGKDVTICRKSNERQGFADGKVWTDKEIIKEHLPHTALQNSCVDRHAQRDWLLDPASGKFKETLVQRFGIESNQAFPSNVVMKPLESNCFQPCLNWQANPGFHNSSLTIARDPSPNLHHFAHPPTSHAIFDNGADLINQTSRVGSQLPTASSSHRNYQNINQNSDELEHKQNLHNVGKSSFNFPFLHPDHAEYVQPSLLKGSSKSLVPWLLQATQQVKVSSSPSQPFPEVGGSPHPCGTQTCCLTNRLVPHLPIVCYDHNPTISYSDIESSVGKPSIAHSLPIPSLPGTKPTSSVYMSRRNRIKVKDRIKSKDVGIQDPDIHQNTRKRPGVQEDYLMKPIKIPNLGIQDEPRGAARLVKENFIDDIQCNTGSLEIEPQRNEASLTGWIPIESQCYGFRLSAGIDSSKVDGVTRAYPNKLSPGVKHLLKASQNVDQDTRC